MDDKSNDAGVLGSITGQGYLATQSSVAPSVRVTDNDLNLLQQELNRSTAKESTCTATAIRREAEHLEAQQALKVAARNTADLKARLVEATRKFHAQRAVDLGISDPSYLPGSGKVTPAEQATAAAQADRVLDNRLRFPVGSSGVLKPGGPLMTVEQLNGDYRICTWDGMEPGCDNTFHVDTLLAAGGPVSKASVGIMGEQSAEAFVQRKILRKYDELSDAEQDEVELVSPTTNPRWKLPSGELINSNNEDVVEE